MPDGWTPDRRRADRQPVRFPLFATMMEGHVAMRVREVGPRGMVVESERPMAAGEAVRCTLGSGAEAIGPIEAHVAHSRLLLQDREAQGPTCLAGIAFDRIPPEGRSRLEALLSKVGAAVRASEDR